MPSQIEWREAKQAASESHLSWLHIRVTLKGSRYLRKQKQERVSVSCRITEENDKIDEIRDLRWRSPDKKPEGEFYIMLEHGRVEYIPVALRNEQDGKTVLTDQSFLVYHSNILQLTRGIYTIVFTLKYGKTEEQSPTFILSIPNSSVSNGHFLLEKLYEDEG